MTIKLGNCPCKDCADRHETCHGVCAKYAEWKITQQEHANNVKNGMLEYRIMGNIKRR